MTKDKKSNSKKSVRILVPIPKFVGKELQVLGPYNKGDIAELPLEIANILIKKDRAEELNKSDKINNYDLDTLKKEIFKDFYGYENIKNGLMLMLASDKPFHIFIIGDPCSGKSLLLNSVAKASKSKIITDISELKKDKSRIIIIDDFDIHMLNDPKEYNEIFNKEKSVLISMRPSFGRFDPYELIHSQVTLPRRMLSEFDLIFPLKDMPSKEKDYDIVTNFLTNKKHEIRKEIIEYIDSLKDKAIILTDEAIEDIRNYYVKMRNHDDTDRDGPIPITLRQIGAIVKVSKIFAKYNHSDKITRTEAKEGIKLMHYILSQIGLDPETGKIDIDRIIAGIKITEIDEGTTRRVLETIKDLEDVIGENIHLSQIIEWCKARNIPENETRKALKQLKNESVIIEPYENIFKKT